MPFDFINSKLIGTVEGGVLTTGAPLLINGGSGVSATFSGLTAVISGSALYISSSATGIANAKLYIINGLIVSASA